MVVPSLPGYGFSEAPKKSGSGGIASFADIAHQLMLKLGYNKYSKDKHVNIRTISNYSNFSDLWY